MKKIALFFIILLPFQSIFAQTTALRQKIEQIISHKKAEVGVAILGFDKHDTLSINGNKHLPMQSVFKLPIAMTVLNEIDKGKLSLSQKIFIAKNDLSQNTWSPLRKKYPDGNIEIPLSEILAFTVSQSDNTGCDILLRLIGGTQTVQKYINSIGIKDFSIKNNEAEMQQDWNLQFENWISPNAAVQLLEKFYLGKILSQNSQNFLMKILLETSTGKNRIKSQLPKGTAVAHKTGTSDKKNDLTAATNDIGIVFLPNGKHFYLSVFVTNSTENDETNEKIIADIAKAAWDYYSDKAK